MKEQEYKETPIGRIPEEWEVKKLGDTKICKKIKAGGTPLRSIKKYYENGTIYFVRIEDISKSQKYLSDTELKITELGLRNSSTWLVPENSILFSMYASYGEVTINKIPVATNQAIIAIVPQEPSDVEYLYYALSNLRTKLYRYLRETTQKNLNAEIVINLIIPFPSSPERQKIASILSTFDEAIQRVDEAIARTERLKRGLMQKLLTKGIGHEEFKDTEIGRIPKDWEVVKLEEVVEIHDSKRIPLSEMERSKRKGIYPYCGANGIIDYIDDCIFDGEFVLLAEDGGDYNNFGKSAYLMSGKFWVNNHAHILSAIKDRITNLFLLYVINFLNLNPYIVGSTRKKLNQEQMREIKIPLPSIPEQHKIAEILSTVEKKVELERKRKRKFKKIKQGLMNDLLTGRKRVKITV